MHLHLTNLILGYYGPIWEPVSHAATAVWHAVVHVASEGLQNFNQHCADHGC